MAGHGEWHHSGHVGSATENRRTSDSSGEKRGQQVQWMRNNEASLAAKGIELGSCGGSLFCRWSKSTGGGAESEKEKCCRRCSYLTARQVKRGHQQLL